ncbi:hypothetical protein E2C01_016650 [Portunus trituberculatus]|uniref:Uncharacterized protein n=1 Tax=Portunus trituberculatus TaxID=210409 RepID=A0A5B7DRI5_PORTR|nr:hypothetical protein [Portunus trituberculatus]
MWVSLGSFGKVSSTPPPHSDSTSLDVRIGENNRNSDYTRGGYDFINISPLLPHVPDWSPACQSADHQT